MNNYNFGNVLPLNNYYNNNIINNVINEENEENEDNEENQENKNNDNNKINNKIVVPGLTGFVNQGNTCYLNCVLQCLASTEFLMSFFLEKKFEETLKTNQIKYLKKKINEKEKEGIKIKLTKNLLNQCIKNTMSKDFYNLINEYWAIKGRNIVPIQIKKRIGKISKDFSGNMQNDSEEALNIILDNIHEELIEEINLEFKENKDLIDFIKIYNIFSEIIKSEDICDDKKEKLGIIIKEYNRINLDKITQIKANNYIKSYFKSNYSIIKEIFSGLYLSRIKCCECGYYNGTFDPFNSIQLQIPNTNNNDVDLDFCIDSFFKAELLQNDNKYNCIRCRKKVLAKKKLELWYLPKVLIIQLKRYDFSNNYNLTKKTCLVKCPLDISMKKYISEINNSNNDYKYELYGICNHIGGTGFGHYTAYVKNPISLLWYEFNDDTISLIDKKDIITDKAYILFYKRVKNE